MYTTMITIVFIIYTIKYSLLDILISNMYKLIKILDLPMLRMVLFFIAVYKYLGFRDYLLDRKSRRMEVTVQKYLAMQEKSDTRCKCTGSWCECENKARARLVEQYRQQQEQTQPASTTPAL